jgi:hypothetical protein
VKLRKCKSAFRFSLETFASVATLAIVQQEEYSAPKKILDMALSCPVCGREVKAGQTRCACDATIDAASEAKRWWGKIKAVFHKTAAVVCPACGHPSSTLQAGHCDNCKTNFTIGLALAPLVRPVRKRWDDFHSRATASTWRTIRNIYALMSAGAFWMVLGVSHPSGMEWLGFALLSSAYLAFLTLFVGLIVPRGFIAAFIRSLDPIKRISLVLNYFTLLILLQVALVTWKQRAFMLGACFGISWLGFYVFLVYLYPVWSDLASHFNESLDAKTFRATDTQARTARRD